MGAQKAGDFFVRFIIKMNKNIKINNYSFILKEDFVFLIFVFIGLYGFFRGIIKHEPIVALIGLIFIGVAIGTTYYISKPRYCKKCNNLMERISTEISRIENDMYRKNIQYKCLSCGAKLYLKIRKTA